MTDQQLYLYGGSAIAGFASGYFAKKVMKILLFVAGAIIVLLLYLQSKGILNINTEKLQNAIGNGANATLQQANHILAQNNSGHDLLGANMLPIGLFGVMFLAGLKYG